MLGKQYFITSGLLMFAVASFLVGKFFIDFGTAYPHESESIVLFILVNTSLTFVMTLFGALALTTTFFSLAFVLRLVVMVLKFPYYAYKSYFEENNYDEFDDEVTHTETQTQTQDVSVEMTQGVAELKRPSILNEPKSRAVNSCFASDSLPSIEEVEEKVMGDDENSDEFVEIVEIV